MAHLILEPAPNDLPTLLDAFRHCVAGRSVADLAEWLSDVRPDRGWSLALVKSMLRNRVYIGEVRAPSGWVRGKHAAIVPLDLWSRAQESKRSRDKGGRRPDGKSRTSTWLVRPALARCGHCGGGMRSAFGRRPEYAYLICANHCGASMLRSAEVDSGVEALVLARLGELREALAHPPAPPPASEPKPRDFGAERARLDAALERVQRGYVDGLLDAAAVTRERDRVRAATDRLAREEAAVERKVVGASPAARAALLADLGRQQRAWRLAPVEVRRRILEVLAGSVVLRHGEPPVPAWRNEEELAVVQTGCS
jgi:hypothetical protein